MKGAPSGPGAKKSKDYYLKVLPYTKSRHQQIGNLDASASQQIWVSSTSSLYSTGSTYFEDEDNPQAVGSELTVSESTITDNCTVQQICTEV